MRLFQRRGRDSNPGTPKGGQRFSRPPRSTTPAPLPFLAALMLSFLLIINTLPCFSLGRNDLQRYNLFSILQEFFSLGVQRMSKKNVAPIRSRRFFETLLHLGIARTSSALRSEKTLLPFGRDVGKNVAPIRSRRRLCNVSSRRCCISA